MTTNTLKLENSKTQEPIQEQNKVCKNCNDTKYFHPINLCYKYEPKLKKKQIVKPIEKSWANYFKSYFVKLTPEIEISEEPVYYEKCYSVSYDDLGKIYSLVDLTSSVGGITNFPSIEIPLEVIPSASMTPHIEDMKLKPTLSRCNCYQFGCRHCYPLPTPLPSLPKVNWLFSMWFGMSNYIMRVYNLLKPVKYITENEMKIQIKNEMKDIKDDMKYKIGNMKDQMLYDLKHKIKNEFIILNNHDNNYKVLIDNSIQDIQNKLENAEVNLDEINKNNHKQKTKILMEEINKNKLINNVSIDDYEIVK